jgi:hypothetical protein
MVPTAPGNVLQFQKCFSGPAKVWELNKIGPKVLENAHSSKMVTTGKFNFKKCHFILL